MVILVEVFTNKLYSCSESLDVFGRLRLINLLLPVVHSLGSTAARVCSPSVCSVIHVLSTTFWVMLMRMCNFLPIDGFRQDAQEVEISCWSLFHLKS